MFLIKVLFSCASILFLGCSGTHHQKLSSDNDDASTVQVPSDCVPKSELVSLKLNNKVLSQTPIIEVEQDAGSPVPEGSTCSCICSYLDSGVPDTDPQDSGVTDETNQDSGAILDSSVPVVNTCPPGFVPRPTDYTVTVM
jgi:hypothetical protein